MHLIPSQEEVVSLLKETGALREGHFEYPSGVHSNEYLQVPLAMRHYQYQRMLSVGLSRLLRANAEIRAIMPSLSIVAPTPNGLPVAFGICEAIRAKQVYWAESEDGQDQLRFWQFLEHQPYEPVILVDDMLRSGNRVLKLKELLEARGAQVMGIAVVIYQPTPTTRDFGTLPLYYLATLEASYYADGGHCELCRQGRPLQKVWS